MPYRGAYKKASDQSYGNVPASFGEGGCGCKYTPTSGFVGSYVPPAYLARERSLAYCSGYPEGAGAKVSKKAPAPSLYTQEGYIGSMGVNSRQLFEGNSCDGPNGCDGFDDVYVDHARDIGYSDMHHANYANVLTTTWNQVYDIRGPPSRDGSCGDCPNKYWEGLYGYNSGDPKDHWLGERLGTRMLNHVEGNKPYRTFGY